MSEADAMARADEPRTVGTLAEDLRTLGLGEGSIVFVHSSLSSLGWVAGRPVAVIQSPLDVLGPEGTLVPPCGVSDR